MSDQSQEILRLQSEFARLHEEVKSLQSVLQPTLFDTQLTEEEQSALDAEVKKMEEQNARKYASILKSKLFRDITHATDIAITIATGPVIPVCFQI